MSNKYLLFIVIGIIFGGIIGFFSFYSPAFIYLVKGTDGMHDYMINIRDHGIAMAKSRGEYKCCIEPACTMCYMEANKWNYGKAGTCACDEYIAKGEEPCPQCAQALNCSSDASQEESVTCLAPE